jgi:bifunctional non-homologous end joining protein LigD
MPKGPEVEPIRNPTHGLEESATRNCALFFAAQPWTPPTRETPMIPDGKMGDVLPRIHPMRLRLLKQPFDDPDYIFELKHDGFRAVVVSRNLKQLRFDSLKKALAKLPVEDAIIDGEIVCLDAKGMSQFNQLLAGKGEPLLYAFDLLWLNGEDLRSFPLIERKLQLNRFIGKSSCDRIIYAQHIPNDGRLFFREICSRDLEGIVAKRKLSVYKDDGNSWIKIKNRSYTQAEGRHELLSRTRRSL